VDRRTFLGTITLGLLAAPVQAGAQQPPKVARIGVLCGLTCDIVPAPFRTGLDQLGYVEGKNLEFELRSAEGKSDRLPALAAGLVALKVDVIYIPGGTPAVLAAKAATSTIPIVFGGVADPVRSGLVSSLARPGGNLTGLSLQSSDMGPKRLDLLKQAVPKASRVGYLRVPGNQPPESAEQSWRSLDATAQSLKLKIHRMEVRGPDDYAKAFSQMVTEGTDSLIVDNSGPLNQNLARIADLALKHRLPAIAEPRRFAEAGGLVAHGPNQGEMQLRAASYVDRILKGAKPADLPVEQPTKFELVINLKTAKALGLTIPQSMLLRADQVIE
jgi:putative ABC transport system substrate-binding protein